MLCPTLYERQTKHNCICAFAALLAKRAADRHPVPWASRPAGPAAAILTLPGPPSPGTSIEEIATHILVHAVRTSRSVQPFQALDSWDQVSVLQECWNELFLLHAAYWPGVDFCALLSHSNLRSESTTAGSSNLSSDSSVSNCINATVCLLKYELWGENESGIAKIY